MTTDLIKKYIDFSTHLLYNKHFYKLILEKRYIENFGDIELSKMKNIYETMVINKKLEESFSLANDHSIQYSNLVEYRARKEFFDLERQIKELEENINDNAKKLKELEFYLSKGIEEAIHTIVSKTSPFVNKSKRARVVWEDFMEVIEQENWKRIIRISNTISDLRIYKPNLEKEMEKEIKDINSQLVALKNRFPFTKLEVLNDEKSIKILKAQESKDIRNMRQSYERMTDIYLSTSITPKWYS